MSPTAVPRVGIVIPARYASSRFPGKPLARLHGASGIARTLVERSWIAANDVPGVDLVVVATDDDRIAEEVERFGGQVIMTPTSCANGTERCAAAVAGMADPPDIIVNLQGDAPLTPASVVASLVKRLHDNPAVRVVTPAIRCTDGVYRHLVEDQMAGRVGGTTVVFDGAGNALYFSKRVIPYLPENWSSDGPVPIFLHMGVYAYRRADLRAYAEMSACPLEQLEGLEQLRFLYNSIGVSVVECPPPDWDVIELNNPSDLEPVQAMLRQRGLE